MVTKGQRPSAEALIEIWREGDRVLIGVPEVIADLPPLKVIERVVHRPLRVNTGRVHEIRAKPEGAAPQEAPNAQVEAEMLTMTEEEWLAADLLALHRQAVDLCRSADETLAYVSEKCAAVHKG